MQDTRAASRTAVFVCQARALAHDHLSVERFQDPIARSLLTPDERLAVDQAATYIRSDGRRAVNTAHAIATCAEAMVPRTVAVDDAIRRTAHGQVVILGLGLDSRPYRLEALDDAVVFAIDHPASLADSTARAADAPVIARKLVRLAVDLAGTDLQTALVGTEFEPSIPTMWVWEGVVPYLTHNSVNAVVRNIASLSAAGSRLVINYQASSLIDVAGRWVAGLLARVRHLEDPFAAEPWLSRWKAETMRDMLERHGFVVESDEDLLSVSERLGSRVTHRRLVRNGRVVVARR
ncbi:MAG TPA: SAM-dependent methyltransferase [Mycobacteriales bacterium]|nr:SAM-dependent methyltransferase [Mycobacteriales bacterium]